MMSYERPAMKDNLQFLHELRHLLKLSLPEKIVAY